MNAEESRFKLGKKMLSLFMLKFLGVVLYSDLYELARDYILKEVSH